ncbi:NAD(+)/NADH kinase [Candidatus Acetothermia bacterium]|nr:NAD(+)/NADH kinase [Candidatus Acetothermia bacterium]MBI3659831.1 NAD(+)/NADH kinase [Candidatus Acetothermia bacterium]
MKVSADLAVSIGGDGTFLKAARYAAPLQIPLLGFNTGALGFLPQTTAEELTVVLQRVLEGQFTIEERSRLGGEFVNAENSARQEFSALNEVVVSHVRPDRFTDIELWCGSELIASYPGDGVILATPTGSTAYSLSAGGPIAEPELPILLVTPLASHQLAIRPLILDGHRPLRLVARFPAQVMVDGERFGSLQPGAEVHIRSSPFKTRLVILKSAPSFFARLAQKLNWSQIPYRKNPPVR